MNHETGSELNYKWFVILDERSIEDESVLLAGYDAEEEQIETVRTTFEIAGAEIGALSVGMHGMSEDREIAKEQKEGVLGRGRSKE